MGMMVIVEGNHITVTIHQVALGSHLFQHFLSVGILLTLMEVLITFPEKEVHHSNFKVNHNIYFKAILPFGLSIEAFINCDTKENYQKVFHSLKIKSHLKTIQIIGREASQCHLECFG